MQLHVNRKYRSPPADCWVEPMELSHSLMNKTIDSSNSSPEPLARRTRSQSHASGDVTDWGWMHRETERERESEREQFLVMEDQYLRSSSNGVTDHSEKQVCCWIAPILFFQTVFVSLFLLLSHRCLLHWTYNAFSTQTSSQVNWGFQSSSFKCFVCCFTFNALLRLSEVFWGKILNYYYICNSSMPRRLGLLRL